LIAVSTTKDEGFAIVPPARGNAQSPIRSQPTPAQALAQLAPVTKQYSIHQFLYQTSTIVGKKIELSMDSKQIKLFCWH
jgi:hypothetical protein